MICYVMFCYVMYVCKYGYGNLCLCVHIYIINSSQKFTKPMENTCIRTVLHVFFSFSKRTLMPIFAQLICCLACENNGDICGKNGRRTLEVPFDGSHFCILLGARPGKKYDLFVDMNSVWITKCRWQWWTRTSECVWSGPWRTHIRCEWIINCCVVLAWHEAGPRSMPFWNATCRTRNKIERC